jgi:hypothetical protein
MRKETPLYPNLANNRSAALSSLCCESLLVTMGKAELFITRDYQFKRLLQTII